MGAARTHKTMITTILRVICFAALALGMSRLAEGKTDIVSRVLQYGQTHLNLCHEAKWLSVSNDIEDRIVAAGLIIEYPPSFDGETAIRVLTRLLGDKSERVRTNALDAVDALIGLPIDLPVGKASVLRALVPLVQERAGDSMRKKAVDIRQRLRRKIAQLAKSK